MARIAIVGTRESGKTVLMTVLAKRYQNRNGDAPFLKAMNPQTMAFTEKNWHRLTVERDWPPLTPPGDLLKLHWALEHEGQSHEIHLVDFAGETFRTVFGKHNLSEPHVRNQLAADPLYGPLLAYLDQADVVVLLVNLRDYVNAPVAPGGMDLMVEHQWALRGALDYVAPRLNNRVAAVFTKIDQYAELVNGRKLWRDVMREHLPATQITDIYPNISCLGVSAILETELGISSGGDPFPRPAANFQSLHMEALMFFLTETCKAIRVKQEAEAARWCLFGATWWPAKPIRVNQEAKSRCMWSAKWSLVTFAVGVPTAMAGSYFYQSGLGGLIIGFGGLLMFTAFCLGLFVVGVVMLQSIVSAWQKLNRQENSPTGFHPQIPDSQPSGIFWKIGIQIGNLIGAALKKFDDSASASQKHKSTPPSIPPVQKQ